jgi:hypothetical protein
MKAELIDAGSGFARVILDTELATLLRSRPDKLLGRCGGRLPRKEAIEVLKLVQEAIGSQPMASKNGGA